VDDITGGGLGAKFPGAFPELSKDEIVPCSTNFTHCTREEFVGSLKKRRFTYLPNSTPGYSNSAFILIGYIIETITNTTFNTALEERVLKPLSLDSTFASKPDDSSKAVLIRNATYSGWDVDISDITAEGGIFTSISDLSAFGRAILSSDLLSPNTTRAWLKPTSFTSSINGFVGRPWEIYRSIVNTEDNRVVDMYTKGGNVGLYASLIVLIPDFDIGFSILIATETAVHPFAVAGILTDILVSDVEEAARLDADKKYAGTWRAQDINSSVVLSSEKGKSGLKIESWISNGTDMFPAFDMPEVFRLYPSNAGGQYGQSDQNNGTHASKVSWKAIAKPNEVFKDYGAFSACPTWFSIDRPGWGIYGADDWVFTVGEEGAGELEIAALKVKLVKVDV
jgi:hypothetical protein